MESGRENLCSVIQYYKGPDSGTNNTGVILTNNFDTKNSVDEKLKEGLTKNNEDRSILLIKQTANNDSQKNKGEDSEEKSIKAENFKSEKESLKCNVDSNVKINVKDNDNDKEYDDVNYSSGHSVLQKAIKWLKAESGIRPHLKADVKKLKSGLSDMVKWEPDKSDTKDKETELETKDESLGLKENEELIKGKKRTLSEANADAESVTASVEEAEANEDGLDSDFEDDEEGAGNKPRRRGRCKKNPDIIPSHLSSDMVLGYKILLKFLETPQFSGFHKPFKKGTELEENCKITCLNQIKKKFEDNLYKKVSEFVKDVREMLINIYESRNQIAIKKALRLEQILEQRIAQLPNYLRPQCALVLSTDEVNNCHNKIRITKGGGFVSLLLERTEKKRYEKNREKRKLLAEERKQLKEEQDKDVQEWEKNILMKDFEEDIKSMWELPAIGHFIHLCADIFNIGEVPQFEVERMLLMPQCSDTLDLIMTALLTNSLMRAKLDRTPSMPYSIWGPLVRTRVMSWYRMWHRDGRNEQKIFEEIGIEPEFWQILGPQINPLDYYYFHEISLLQRVWILKTLCDVDFVRKKTVYDNIRAQTLDELNPITLGLDQQGNRYIQFKQFCGSDIRIYRQRTKLEGNITPSDLIESTDGFESREGPITVEKVFKDIWELNEKPEIKPKKKKSMRNKRAKNFNAKVTVEPTERKNLRQSAREKQKTYADWSDSDQSDTDLRTLRNKLLKSDTESLYRPFSDKEFISLSVFRLPREKVNKPGPKRSSYAGRRAEDANRNDGDKIIKCEPEDRKEDLKPSACDDEQSDSLDAKQMQNIQTDFDKNFHGDDMMEDEFDLRGKISNCELDNSDVKFTVKNLENLKMVFKKGSPDDESERNISGAIDNSESESQTSTRDKEYDALYKHKVPNHLKPDSSKFYLVVDSVEGLRQLISKFGSHENDLEIITRSTKSKKKASAQNNTSSEVQLIEKLQNLLLELEPWELDLMKSTRLNKEKMYKEYMNFISRPPDFVHPNESYWMKTYEEPTSATTSATATTAAVTTIAAEGTASNPDKNVKESSTTAGESTGDISHQDASLDTLGLRKRTRVTRMQLQPESDDLDEDDDGDDYESNESDDNWVLPTPKKRPKKEATSRTPKLPKRSVCKKVKSSPFEKTDSQTNTGEKNQGFSPEKVKKALFWGPRSSDPSEDLNWETNRQKILEQHNSPVKKLIKSEETTNDPSESENARQNTQKLEGTPQSVIIASPKRLTAQIPGNKKPYFSSAQLKAIESQTKKSETEKKGEEIQKIFYNTKTSTPKSEVKTPGISTSPDFPSTDSGNKPPVKIQTYSRIKKAQQAASVVSQTVNKPGQPAKQGGSVAALSNSQVVRYAPQVCTITTGAESEQKPAGQVQILQSGGRPQQIQIQELGQNRVITSVANVKLQQQPVQWQQKVISVQPVNQPGKIIQQQGQTHIQAQIQNPPQGQSSSQTVVQLQEQGEPPAQKSTVVQQPVQVPPEKLGNFLQMVATQTQGGTINTDGDLYITDGKNLMKFDNNFVQQLQKDKVVTLDLKKTLLLVKPKPDSNQSTSQGQPQISASQTQISATQPQISATQPQIPAGQQNILVINKPTTVQQTVATTSVPNFVIPANYIIKEGSQQAQGEQGQQTVKIVQQSPTYVIQQKSILNKSLQPQVIKIITSQPMGTNQNIILTPVAGQVIQPISQTTEHQNKQPPTTLRLVRPQITTSVASNTGQNKVNPVQSSIIVNNIVQIQGQRLDTSKPQTSVVAGRILSTAVPTVRMAAPHAVTPSTQLATQAKSESSTQPQTQSVLASSNLKPQAAPSELVAQPLRLATITQSEFQTPITSTSTGPRFVVSNTPTIRMATTQQSLLQSSAISNQTPTVRFVTSPQQVAASSAGNTQVIKSSGSSTPQVKLTTSQPHTVIQTAAAVNTQTVRLVSQPQLVEPQTVVASTNVSPQMAGSSGNLNAQSVKIVQPQQFQTQTLVPCVNLNSQTVRLATSTSSQPIRFVQSQPVRIIANNSVGVKFVNRSPPPVKAAVITNAAQASVVGVSNVRPSGVVCQPVRYQAVLQTTGVKPVQNRMQFTYGKKTVKANTLANAPVVVLEDEEDDISILGEKITEPPVTLDYINGELSVKKTSQGWKYAVKASNGKDIILTDEQIEERLKANNGVMK